MGKPTNRPPDYGNWVSKKLLYGSGALALLFWGLSFLLPGLAIGAVFFFITFAYLVYARAKFSPTGGNLQIRIRDLVLDRLNWDGHGEALDIGCGNGPLTIQAAKKYKDATVIRIDMWSSAWEYSQEDCEKNAILEGVSERVTFQKASASRLPFNDERFDAVVSNFVFHEVSDTKDKRDLIREALRVVKKGRVFSFQDFFLVKKIYGETNELLETIRDWGIESVDFLRTNDLDFIPWALKLPFMVGEIGIIYGRK